MITLILKSYFGFILGIFVTALSLFSVIFYCILRRFFSAKNQQPKIAAVESKETTEDPNDLTAIAGDDVIATQLDLARAYIETGRKQFAVAILQTVTLEGNATQREEAQELLSYL